MINVALNSFPIDTSQDWLKKWPSIQINRQNTEKVRLEFIEAIQRDNQ